MSREPVPCRDERDSRDTPRATTRLRRPAFSVSVAAVEPRPDPELVTRLLREQAPDLASLTPRPTPSSGSSNWVLRLGETLAVRLPRGDEYVADLAAEVRWLPRLGPQLPVAVPQIRHVGEPSALFPRPWTVVTWVAGELPVALDATGRTALARTLGGFVRRLHAVDTGELGGGEDRWGYRAGEPVTERIDGWADDAAADLADLFDPAAVREAWRRLREVPPPTTPPCWIHTDLSAENVLVDHGGRLVGVIDFGGVAIGDRAVDLLYAWDLFDAPARAVFRDAAGVDDATWRRARAWAFVGPGLVTVAGHRHTMPGRTARLVAMVEAVAAEVGVALR